MGSALLETEQRVAKVKALDDKKTNTEKQGRKSRGSQMEQFWPHCGGKANWACHVATVPLSGRARAPPLDSGFVCPALITCENSL